MARHSLQNPPGTQRAMPWGNRIVGIGMQKAGQLLANPDNPRTHGLSQEGQLTALLDEVGFVTGVIVNKRTSPKWGRDRNVETLVDGHLRVKAALARDEETEVPVTYVDLEPAEERRVLLQLDPIGAMAGNDRELLEKLSDQVVMDWPQSDIDIEALFGSGPRKKTQGLAHDVKECLCCKGEGKCKKGCGCYREEE